MMNRLTRVGLVMALGAPMILADFKYDQSSKMTGGAMMAMMKMAARFSKGALDGQNSTIAVKGNRMVMNHGKAATIYDLDKENITEINFEKKEYSVTTFAEMKAFLEKAMAKTGGNDTSIEVDVKETGKTQTVNGLPAKEVFMSMKFESTNPQTGQKGEMRMEMSNWMTPKLPGYDEVAHFHQRMAEKMDLAGMFGGAAQAGMGKGMAAAAKKMAAMDGLAVLQIVRMIPTDPEQIKQMEQAQQAQAQQAAQQSGQPQPSAGQVAGDAAGQAATGAVAGRLGRIGGLGSAGLGGLGGLRRKKAEEPPPPPPPPPPPTASAPAAETSIGSFSGTASLMEMTMESKNHSNSPVDDGMFAVPAGFKAVKSTMQK